MYDGPLSLTLEQRTVSTFGYFEIVLRSLTQQLRMKLATMRRAAAVGQMIASFLHLLLLLLCGLVSNDEDNRKREFTITI